MIRKNLLNILLLPLLIGGVSATLSTAVFAQSSPTLNDLSFLEGHWEGDFRGDRTYEKHWSRPNGNTIMGMLRFINADGETVMFELLTLEPESSGEIILRVKHFQPGLLGRQEKNDSDRYRLIEAGGNRAVFEHEASGDHLMMQTGSDIGHLVQRGVMENGERVWNDLFVGKRAR